MLAALEEGLATGWSTGGLVYHPRLPEVLGADAAWECVALLYIGRPAQSSVEPLQRTSFLPYTRWLD